MLRGRPRSATAASRAHSWNISLALFRQPHGLEGGSVIWEKAETHYLAVAEGIDQGEGRKLADDAGVSPPLALIADQDHYLVVCVDDVLNVELDVSPSLEPASPVGPYALMAPVDVHQVGDQVPRSKRVPFDLWVDDGDVEVPVGEALDSLWVFDCLGRRADHFHVLLRHRLLRQTDGLEGLGVIPEVLVEDDPPVSNRRD